jgi:hypothetical protein
MDQPVRILSASATLVQDKPNAEAITMIENLLERLKSGDTIAVAFVEVAKRRTVSIWAPAAPDGCYHCLNSGAARLAMRITQAWDE